MLILGNVERDSENVSSTQIGGKQQKIMIYKMTLSA